MQRKTVKIYNPFIKQIDHINGRFNSNDGKKKVVAKDLLVSSALNAFAEAQHVFVLSLDIRLVFMKLFEQHFLLKMERMFLDIISILNNAQKSALIEAEISEQLEFICTQDRLPLFLEKMIRTHWRAVMFLIGINRGSASLEWREAIHTISLLAKLVGNKIQISDSDRNSIENEIEMGFRLIQLEKDKQDQFSAELDSFFLVEMLASSSGEEGDKLPPEETISLVGEKILDLDDMKDIANLFAGDEAGDSETQVVKRDELLPKVHGGNQLNQYLSGIEHLADGSLVEYSNNGRIYSLTLYRSRANPDLYTLADGKSKLTLNRCRLGLAMSLQTGELKLPRKIPTSPIPKTVLRASVPKYLS